MSMESAGPPRSPDTSWWHVLKRTDVLSGLMFMTVAILALWFSRDYPIGTSLRMGTGYVPRLLAWILLGLGLVVLLQDLWKRDAYEPVADSESLLALRPVFFVTLGIVVFGLLIERMGLVIAVLALIGIVSLAKPGKRIIETAIMAVVLAAGAVVIFIYGLGLTLPIWPES